MIRSLLIVILIVAFLILSIPILIVEWIIGKFNPYARDISSLRIVQFMFKLILFVAGTKVTVIGEDRIPKDTPVLYVGNHRSYFDVVLTYARCPGLTGYFCGCSSFDFFDDRAGTYENRVDSAAEGICPDSHMSYEDVSCKSTGVCRNRRSTYKADQSPYFSGAEQRVSGCQYASAYAVFPVGDLVRLLLLF